VKGELEFLWAFEEKVPHPFFGILLLPGTCVEKVNANREKYQGKNQKSYQRRTRSGRTEDKGKRRMDE
jgi:hypothetical protein